MSRWSPLDERVAHTWWAAEQRRRQHRSLARQSATVMREVADTRRYVARVYDQQADRATGETAMRLRSRARRFDELAARARRYAETEEEEASRE